jgi:hypothetical protein
MRMRAEDESAERIALQRKGAGKKLLRPLRLTSPSAAGVARAASTLTVRQALISVMEGTIAWTDWRAD